MISKFQREVTAWTREQFVGCDINGYDTGEANLGHLANMTGCNLRADILIWIDDLHVLVVECHSELHDERGKNAFGGSIEDYYGRLGRDELKKVLINRLGFGLVEVWPNEDYQKKIMEAVDSCPQLEISYNHKTTGSDTIKDTQKKTWKKQTLTSEHKFESTRKMPKGQGFKKGRKFNE